MIRAVAWSPDPRLNAVEWLRYALGPGSKVWGTPKKAEGFVRLSGQSR